MRRTLCEKPFSLEIIGAAMNKESYTALANIRSWDIKNFFRSGKFVLPQSLRKKLKAALDTVEENGSSNNRQSAQCCKFLTCKSSTKTEIGCSGYFICHR
jgi:hypothetical protein